MNVLPESLAQRISEGLGLGGPIKNSAPCGVACGPANDKAIRTAWAGHDLPEACPHDLRFLQGRSFNRHSGEAPHDAGTKEPVNSKEALTVGLEKGFRLPCTIMASS